MTTFTCTDEHLASAQVIWNYLRLGHPPRPCSAAIGMGSHDLGVAATAAELYGAGLFPVIVFSGGNSPTTKARFPRGEAVHYREHALALGVPEEAILLEPRAGNTGQNIEFSRRMLNERAVQVNSVLLIAKPYMERRSFATCRRLWPDVEVVCASTSEEFGPYLKSIGDVRLVVDMLTGELQRLIDYPDRGFIAEQYVPDDVKHAYEHLVRDGFDSRLINT